MKKLLSFIIACLTLVACSCTQNTPGPVDGTILNVLPIEQELLEYSLRSTVGLVARGSDPGSEHFSCTGVIISPELVLTAEHCIDNDERTFFGGVIPGPDPTGDRHEIVYYSMYQESEFDNTVTYEVLHYDNELDLAVLRRLDGLLAGRAEDIAPGRYEISGLHVGETRIGEFAYIIGHPIGIPYNVSSGYVSSLLTEEDGRHSLYTNVHVFFGNSGGPIFDARGRIMGIVSQIAGGQPYLNRGVHLISIREFLDDHGIRI